MHEPGYERWDGNGALGYLTLAAIVEAQLADPPEHARWSSSPADCFPTGMLGYWARKLADGGLVAALTATSPRAARPSRGRAEAHGHEPARDRDPDARTGEPLVSDVSMGRVTYGEVLAGEASEDELVPFGGEQAHKAFALAVGLQLLVDALSPSRGTARCSLVARPEADPLPALRARAAGLRLPGDR